MECVKVGSADGLGGGEGPAAGEHRQSCEQLLLFGGEELVAPVDRRLQRALALGRVARAGGGHGQMSIQPGEDLGRWEHLGPRGGEFDRER